MKKLLITGLNGVIGWNVWLEAQQHSFELHATYRRYLREFSGPQFYRIDIQKKEQVFELVQRLQPDYLIHAWHMCDLDVCEQYPELAERINIQGTHYFLQACAALPSFKKFVYVSTDHVFDGEKGQYHEEDEPLPKHVYGRTKVEAEALVQKSSLPFLIIRPGLVIGSSVQGNKGPRDFLFSRLKSGKKTQFFSDEWRSPISAKRLSQTTLSLMQNDRIGVFHVADSRAQDRYKLAQSLALQEGLSTNNILSRLRSEDLEWGHIRPKDISLTSIKLNKSI